MCRPSAANLPNSVRFWLLLAAVALTLLPLAAPLMAARHPLAAMLVRAFFSHLCHQKSARSFFLDGSQVAVCVRCLGIYFGAALAVLRMYRLSNANRWLGIALFLNVIDVVTELLHWHGNLPGLRFFLGLLIGAATGALLFQGPKKLGRAQHPATVG
jgi:uncharacterized membrane protein